MLIDKKEQLNFGDVVVIKTTAGEEVTGRLVRYDADQITLTKPVSLALHQVGPGQGAVGFAPFMLGLADDASVTFQRENLVVHPIKARPDLAAQYLKATTGLEVPTQKLVV